MESCASSPFGLPVTCILAPSAISEDCPILPQIPNPLKDEKPLTALQYTGDIPISIAHYFQRKLTYPVYVPELGLFGKINTEYPINDGITRFTVMGSCASQNGPIQYVNNVEWKKISEYSLNYGGPFVVYKGMDPNIASIPSTEEIDEASEEIYETHPLVDLQYTLDNLPKNKILAKCKKETAIVLVNAKLHQIGELAREHEQYVTKWVSEDYHQDGDDIDNPSPPSPTREEDVKVPKLLVCQYWNKRRHLVVEGDFLSLLEKDLIADASSPPKEKKPINDRIRSAVVHTPQAMIKPPTTISNGEEEVWLNLDEITKETIWSNISTSPMHAHLILNEFRKDRYTYYKHKFTIAFSTLGKMMFYCLKRLRFGDLCLKQSNEEALKEENISNPLKSKWQAVSKEERTELLACISRMIFKTSHFYISENKTISFLNQFLPFWNIPGVNFTGSICCFLSLDRHSYSENIARFYTPTRYEIFIQDLGIDDRYYYSHFRKNIQVYPMYIYFPYEGSSEFFTQKLKLPVFPERDLIRKFINENAPLKPESEITTPMACILLRVDNAIKMMLVKILPNTDCDVPVFQHEELDNIALKVYTKVKRTGTVLERQERGSGSHCWNISMSPRIPEEYISTPKACTKYIKNYMNFYPVQIYRTREEHIWTHHVAMTRLYGTCVNDAPEFSASPDQLNSVINMRSERYNYFAGKITPLSILNKYKWRRFEAPHYITKKIDLFKHYYSENLPIPIGLVTTKFDTWLNSNV